MKKILALITVGMLMLNLITVFESSKVTDNNVIAQGITYELADEDHGGLRG
ncbi:hypothetical protein [Caloranaerobacter ferrireducens]|uniref:hypothetical protein n=1 Tax=Caloranaerobacter ferrireducens TaxID=1323370 RepID=UPI00159F3142|nr:hypothetical protein [Caloranaerobacter ferrireducens]